MENDNVVQASKVFRTLCSYLDDLKWHYEKNEESFSVKFDVRGKDLDVSIVIRLNTDLQIVYLSSVLPLHVPEDRVLELALAVNGLNTMITGGYFLIDCFDGELEFRMTTSYADSVVGKELFGYMISAAFENVDRYNDRFVFLIKEVVSLRDFFRLTD